MINQSGLNQPLSRSVTFILSLLILVAIAAISVPTISAQDAVIVDEETYNKWVEENKRIEEENKKIDEHNRAEQERYDREMAEYNKQLEDYNNKMKAFTESRTTAPVVQNAAPIIKTQVVVVTPTPTPVQQVTIQTDGKLGETDKKDIEAINTMLKDKNISVIKNKNNTITLKHNKITVTIPFPVIAQSENKTIQVITSKGTKTIKHLPEDVAKKLVKDKVMDTMVTTMTMEEQNGVLVYVASGKKTHKVLRIFNMENPVTVKVSAETGAVVSETTSFALSFAKKLSF